MQKITLKINKNTKPIPLLKDTYLKLLKNSVGTKMFNSYYIKEGKARKDLLKRGDLSCAFFVSSVLKIFGWIKEIHLTVDKTKKDLIKSGWRKIDRKNIKEGDVIIWKTEKFKDEYHRHTGFYIGNNKAVSTSFKRKQIILHDLTFGGKREIDAIYNMINSE